MSVSPTALNGITNAPILRSTEVPEVRSIEENTLKTLETRFADGGEYETKCKTLLNYLNNILDKSYSFGTNGLPIETIFNENSFANDKTICNAGKKAYAYYLKEVLQKLNLLNQHILKGQDIRVNRLSYHTMHPIFVCI